jgi:aminoglycoside/choline kinase family phosphotransferase
MNPCELEPWARHALAAVWRGSRLKGMTVLKGDASSRRFWRVFIEAGNRRVPKTAIAVDLGPEDLPLYARALKLFAEPPAEPPFTNVHRFLSSIGAAVPEIYYAQAGERRLLVEDVGDRSLLKAARCLPDTVDDLYRLAVEQLLLIHVKGTRRLDQRCIASRIAYDERLFRWELEHFVEFGLGAVAPVADAAAINPELDELAARLGRIPRVFSHRDYHGENLFIQDNGRLRVIDFQDALLAPAAQDLAVLLTTRDTASLIRPPTEQRLLEYYMTGLLRAQMPGLGTEEFLESYRLCVLQHALKAIGRFVWLEREGKLGYAAYIPHALAQARRMLEQRDDFPRMRAALQA